MNKILAFSTMFFAISFICITTYASEAYLMFPQDFEDNYYPSDEIEVYLYKNFDDVNKTFGVSKEYEYAQDIYINFSERGVNNIVCYELGLPKLQEFIENPTKEFLYELRNIPANEGSVFEFLESKNSSYRYLRTILLSSEEYVFYPGGGHYVDKGSFPGIDRDFLEFCNEESLQEVLKNNHIEETIKDRALVTNSNYPIIVWIETENNYYFLTYDARIWTHRPFEENYEIYNCAEFQEEFTRKSGTLIIDDFIIPGDDMVFFYGDSPKIKLRPLLEALSGREIIWNEENRSVIFYINDDKVEYFLGKPTLECILINDEISEEAYKWSYVCPFFIDGSLYYHYPYLWYLLESYNKKIDTEERKVIISDMDK